MLVTETDKHMVTNIPRLQMERLSAVVEAQFGLKFEGNRLADLEKNIGCASRDLGYENVSALVDRLLSGMIDKKIVRSLASSLTVGETFFFRDSEIFQRLKEEIMPNLIANCLDRQKPLRIWSAGCATGEEPYSLAIVINELAAVTRDVNISIIATDINPHFLSKAESGVYTEWSFRDTPDWCIRKYFQKVGKDHYQISEDIRHKVSFSYLNLAHDIFPSLLNNTNAMDMIFCRNVMMYMTDEAVTRVLNRFRLCLLDDGYLIVNPVEVTRTSEHGFVRLARERLPLFRKAEPSVNAPEEIDPAIVANAAPGPEREPLVIAEPPARAGTVHVEERQTKEMKVAGVCDVSAIRSLIEKGLLTEAGEMITEHLPNDAEAYEMLGKAMANRGQLDDSLGLLEKAVALDKLNPARHYLVATVYLELGMLQEAREAIRNSLFLNHGFVLAHFAMGNLCRLEGKKLEAEKHLVNVILLLEAHPPEEVVAGSEGLSVGQLKDIVMSIVEETAA